MVSTAPNQSSSPLTGSSASHYTSSATPSLPLTHFITSSVTPTSSATPSLPLMHSPSLPHSLYHFYLSSPSLPFMYSITSSPTLSLPHPLHYFLIHPLHHFLTHPITSLSTTSLLILFSIISFFLFFPFFSLFSFFLHHFHSCTPSLPFTHSITSSPTPSLPHLFHHLHLSIPSSPTPIIPEPWLFIQSVLFFDVSVLLLVP